MIIPSRLWRFIDWLYPCTCVSCAKPATFICADCQKDIHEIRGQICPKCGRPLSGCQNCTECDADCYDFARATFTYEGAIASAIKALKYAHNLGMSYHLSAHLADTLQRQGWNIDFICAVPISEQRLRKRGFNQAEWLARYTAEKVNLPYHAQAIQRTMYTEQQVGLSREERMQNLKQAFQAESTVVKQKRIVLIDDVMTTGTTFNECARALKKAGAIAVYCLCVAVPTVKKI